MITQYPAVVRITAGSTVVLQTPKISLTPLTPALVKAEIDGGRPVIAGISPHAGMLPPGLAEHAVLIIGYGDGDNMLVVNDPFPYQAAGMMPPYTQYGGTQLQPGRFSVPYASMVGPINWQNAVYDIHP